jgi:hypothetical protein
MAQGHGEQELPPPTMGANTKARNLCTGPQLVTLPQNAPTPGAPSRPEIERDCASPNKGPAHASFIAPIESRMHTPIGRRRSIGCPMHAWPFAAPTGIDNDQECAIEGSPNHQLAARGALGARAPFHQHYTAFKPIATGPMEAAPLQLALLQLASCACGAKRGKSAGPCFRPCPA